MEKYIPVLKKSFLFSGIQEHEFMAMLGCLSATAKKYPKNSYIFRAGDSVSTVGLVLSGSIHIIKEDFWGNRTILNQATPGQLFAEAFSCAQTSNLPVSVVSASPCEVMFFNYQKILSVCSSACSFHARLIQNMLKTVAENNLALTRKIEHISQKTTRDKLLSYLSEQAQTAGQNSFTIPFNRQQLADYLGVDRSAMSNELGKMKDEGVVDFDKNYFSLQS